MYHYFGRILAFSIFWDLRNISKIIPIQMMWCRHLTTGSQISGWVRNYRTFFWGGWTSMAFIELPKILWHLWFPICEVVCTASPCVSDTEHTLSTLRTGVSWARKRSPPVRISSAWGSDFTCRNDDSLCEVIPGQPVERVDTGGLAAFNGTCIKNGTILTPLLNIGVSTTDNWSVPLRIGSEWGKVKAVVFVTSLFIQSELWIASPMDLEICPAPWTPWHLEVSLCSCGYERERKQVIEAPRRLRLPHPKSWSPEAVRRAEMLRNGSMWDPAILFFFPLFLWMCLFFPLGKYKTARAERSAWLPWGRRSVWQRGIEAATFEKTEMRWRQAQWLLRSHTTPGIILLPLLLCIFSLPLTDRITESQPRRLWLEELADGAFRDVLEEIPSNFTGQMLVTWWWQVGNWWLRGSQSLVTSDVQVNGFHCYNHTKIVLTG